jgi:hypothetical protein
MAPVLTGMGDASSLASVAVAGREPRAAADEVVKDVEAWLPFSQTVFFSETREGLGRSGCEAQERPHAIQFHFELA